MKSRLRKIRPITLLCILCLVVAISSACSSSSAGENLENIKAKAVDKGMTDETAAMLDKMFQLKTKGTMIGQHDGVWMEERKPMTSYISQMIRKMFLELSQYNLLVKYLDGDNPDLTLTDDFDAIVSLAYNDSVERLASKVKIPVVAINHPMRQACFCQIMSDHRQSARIAAVPSTC